jgi:hypothetical protein
MEYHIAQVNIGRMKGDIDGPVMAGFASRLNEINALADAAPGFVWRLKGEENNATYLRPYNDERIIFNMSVWRDVESLRHYVYKTTHVELLRQRHEWFEKFHGVFAALWWVPAGHIPSVDEAKKRLEYLQAHGPSEFAFTFQRTFPPDETFQGSIDWASFEPCPAR